MSSEILHRAAAILIERASLADPHPWSDDSSVQGDTVIFAQDGEWVTNVASARTYADGVVCFDHEVANGAYIATVHPGVAIALAHWLEFMAERAENGIGNRRPAQGHAIAVATQILREVAP